MYAAIYARKSTEQTGMAEEARSVTRQSRGIFEEIGLYKRPMNTEQMEEIKRHFGVGAESLRSDIRQIAEGHAAMRQELQGLRGELRDEFKEMRALMRFSFAQLG